MKIQEEISILVSSKIEGRYLNSYIDAVYIYF